MVIYNCWLSKYKLNYVIWSFFNDFGIYTLQNSKNYYINFKNIFFLCAFTIADLSTFSQESDSVKNCSADLSVDIVSRYVWRGINLSESPAIQPNLAFSYKGLSIGSWASYSFARETFQEVDLFLTYETNHLTFTINDYYNPIDTLGGKGDYFKLKNKTTRHILEGMLTVNGSDNFPFSFITAVMFYGNDRGEDGKNLYSTYFELSYTKKIQEIEVTPFMGFTPSKGYYAKGSNFVNIGITAIKNIDISDRFQLPLAASFVINPELDMVYFVLGITF
jgi:hypothetical protein